MSGLLKLMGRQSLAFWLLCFYFFLEYVRPQSIWPVIDVLPWSQTAILACTAAAIAEGKVRVNAPLTGLLAVYVGVVVLSVMGAYEPAAAIGEWQLIVNWVLVFFLTVSLVDTEERFFLFLILYMLWNFKMSQHATRSWAAAGFGFRDWGVTGAPGWFHNSGEFGIQMTMFFPVSLYFAMTFWKQMQKTWKKAVLAAFPITCAIGIIGSSSRGAYLGLAAVGLVFLLQSRRMKIAAVVVGLLACVTFLVPSEQWDRFSEAGEDRTSEMRLVYWQEGLEIMNRYPVLGVGFNNWLPYYSDHYPARGQWGGHQLPHNIFIEAGSELGYTGLGVFILLIFGTFAVNLRTRRIGRRLGPDGLFLKNMAYGLDGALVGYLVSGFFVTVLYYPFFWVNLAMTAALNLAARNQMKRVRSQRQVKQTRRGTTTPVAVTSS